MLDDGAIEMTLECIPKKKTFRGGWIGLFWASYIHKPASGAIHFKGREVGGKGKAGWIESTSPRHGVDATHPAEGDDREFKHDKDFPLTLVFNLSKWRYSEPWYYGVSGDVAFAQIFRPKDKIRLTQSPSGGGGGNPAWDFQFFIADYKVGQRLSDGDAGRAGEGHDARGGGEGDGETSAGAGARMRWRGRAKVSRACPPSPRRAIGYQEIADTQGRAWRCFPRRRKPTTMSCRRW